MSFIFFVVNSMENYEINQYQPFQLTLPMRFHFKRSFKHHPECPIGHCVVYKSILRNRKC